MTMKASDYFRALDQWEGRAQRLVDWTTEALAHARKLRDEADAHGVPENAREQLDAYRMMLDEGPPDGTALGGEATTQGQPARTKREREPCSGCGSRRGHKPSCNVADRQTPSEASEKEQRHVDLAAKIRVLGSVLPSEAAEKLGVPLADVKEAWSLAVVEST